MTTPWRRRLYQWSDPPNLLAAALGGKDHFFWAQGEGPVYDYPNPRIPQQPLENRGFIRGSNVQLIGQDQFFAAHGEPLVYDWQNPRIPQQPQENKSFVRGANIQLFGQDQFFAAPGESPRYDYPNPQRPRYPVQPEPPPNLLAVVYQFILTPFAQTDWPNPLVPRQPQENRWFVHGANVQLFSQDRFFGAAGEPPTYDWQNPQLFLLRQPQENRGFVRGSNIQLFGQDQFFGLAGQVPVYDWPNPRFVRAGNVQYIGQNQVSQGTPFAQTDWPNPSPPRQPQENRGFLRGANVQLIGQDTFFSGPGNAPDYDYPNPQKPRQPVQPDAPPNLLLTTFFVAGPTPFYQTDWPNPQAPQQPQENRGFLRDANVYMIGQDRFFGAVGEPPTYDWPLPQRKRYAAQLELPFNFIVGLLEIPFVQTDWPLPPRPRYPVQPDNQPSLIVGPLAVPFAPISWPLPQVPRQPQENQGFVHGAAVQLIGQDAFFAGPGIGPEYDWPNPQRPRQPLQPEPPPNLLTTTVFVVGAPPFNQFDWPLPQAPRQPQESRGFVRGVNVQLIGQDQFFAAPGIAPTYTWPNPLRPRQPAQPDSPSSFLVSILAVPFAQTDWPMPLRPRYLVQADSAANFLVGLLAVPFAQTDWPLPRTPAQPQENRWFVHTAAIQLIGQDTFFGAHGESVVYHWPNPQAPRQPQENRGFVHNASVLLIGIDRFFGAPGQAPVYDWPNPQLPRQPQENRGFTGERSPQFIGPEPFYQLDWPLPQTPRQSLENRGFVGQPLVRYIGIDQFFGAPGEAPHYDWPLPQRARQPVQPEPPPDPLLALYNVAPSFPGSPIFVGGLFTSRIVRPVADISRPVTVQGGQSVTAAFTTRDFATGQLTNMQNLPPNFPGFLIIQDGAATAAEVDYDFISTGTYSATFLVPTIKIGSMVELLVSVAVNSLVDNAVIWRGTTDVNVDASGEVSVTG